MPIPWRSWKALCVLITVSNMLWESWGQILQSVSPRTSSSNQGWNLPCWRLKSFPQVKSMAFLMIYAMPTVLIGLEANDLLSILPDDISLRVLFEPAKDYKDLLRTRMSEMKSGKSLRFKMLGNINDLPAAMEKTADALDTIDKLNKAIEKMNTSIEGLTTENKELKKENQKMNTSIEALTKKHDKDIAKLFEELSEEKRCHSEELETIRQVRWNSVTVNKSTIIANINCSAWPLHNPYPSTRSPWPHPTTNTQRLGIQYLGRLAQKSPYFRAFGCYLPISASGFSTSIVRDNWICLRVQLYSSRWECSYSPSNARGDEGGYNYKEAWHERKTVFGRDVPVCLWDGSMIPKNPYTLQSQLLLFVT